MNRPRILALGLNPAWQKTLNFDCFRPGEVNRAKAVSFCAAGKGVNFARASLLWGRAEAVVAQFVGGSTGKALTRAMDAERLSSLNVEVEEPTRTCTTLLSASAPLMTELIEPSGLVGEESCKMLLGMTLDALASVDALAICGTCPPGVPDSFYGSMADAAAKRRLPTLVDSVVAFKSTLPLVKDGLLKVNLDELKAMTGAVSPEAALKGCLETFGLPYVAASDGPRPAWLAGREGVWTFAVPCLEEVKNPLGAGDTCSAVTLSEILSGTPIHEAFAFGLAAASASCLEERCAFLSKGKALEIRGSMSVNFRPWV